MVDPQRLVAPVVDPSREEKEARPLDARAVGFAVAGVSSSPASGLACGRRPGGHRAELGFVLAFWAAVAAAALWVAVAAAAFWAAVAAATASRSGVTSIESIRPTSAMAASPVALDSHVC